MAKDKNFDNAAIDAFGNPASAYISQSLPDQKNAPQSAESSSLAAGEKEENIIKIPGIVTAPIRENRSAQLHLYIKPSSLSKLKAIALKNNMKVNDMMNKLIDAICEQNG